MWRVPQSTPHAADAVPVGQGMRVAPYRPDGLTSNWLRVLGTAERAQIDQRVYPQLHAIMPLLDALTAEQHPLERVFPRQRPLDPQA